ncbi:glycosyltransferase [Portibacter lacus]|uniref:Glycosyltransferase 2-like domain-containing protein n=1 Tax=Portibacter lacus TaxID=1099794 RepID=A0AA37SQK0_9BACT|nr:glycosyltransferase [Portibacter lacus]GLR18863.1 hypothetical protein GCM10007940_34790 [Portibacter lacus]
MLSIITPVLNGAKFIEKNISSIQSLDIPHEHIIVDGGSDDGTLDIVDKFPHLILLKQKEKSGMYGAIHEGILETKGDFLSYVNADDTIEKNGFQAMYKEITSLGNDLVYSDAEFHFIETNKYKYIKGHRFAIFFLRKGIMPFVQPSSIYSKNIYNKVGGLRFDKFKLFGDLDLFQRITQHSKKVSYVPQKSAVFMMREDSLAHKFRDAGKKELQFLKYYKGDKLWVKALFKLTR